MALVSYTGKNVLGVMFKSGDIFRFMPGVNEVEDKVLEEMKKHPLFISRVNKGIVQILEVKKGNDGKQEIAQLLSNIPSMFDLKLLKKLIKEDGRDQIVKAAQDQIDLIKNPKKDKEMMDEHFK